MKFNKIKVFLSVLFFCVFLLKAGFVLGLETKYPSVFGLTITDASSFPEYAKYFFNIGVGIAGILAVMTIAFGGVYYLVSLGRGKFTDEGKDWIKAGILGLFIILCAYLIVYTINPDLVIFRLKGLMPVIFTGTSSDLRSNIPKRIFEEIPIGTLTENLLSRQMDCYDFDIAGDPIQNKITTEDGTTFYGPTYLNHDRADCLIKISEAVKKKSDLAQKLAEKIAQLMQACQCGINGCEPDWQEGQCSTESVSNTDSERCKSQKANCECKEKGGCELCPPGTKKKIEHGPIQVNSGTADCPASGKQYKGLDEFRAKTNTPAVYVEKIYIVDKSGKKITAIDSQNWDNLRLVEQIMYFKEKIEEIKNTVKKDLDVLSSAEDKIGNKNCYITKAYVDFLKTSQETKTTDTIIMKQPVFNDPVSQAPVDITKYCKGFSYANSNCFNVCQNICPGWSEQDFKRYASCPDCSKADPDKKAECLKDQKTCMREKFNLRQCASNSSFSNFGQCISACKNQCADNCAKKYPGCSEEYKQCKILCDNDSKCVLDNQDTCIINYSALQRNAASATDTSLQNLKNTLTRSYLCQYGSDQYAGYQECMANSFGKKYSSDYLYQHPGVQLCEEPYSYYYDTGAYCIDIFPKTAKCPAASFCPDCPCGIVQETTLNCAGGGGGTTGPCPGGKPMQTCADGIQSCNCPNASATNTTSETASASEPETCTTETNTVYRVVTGQCVEYAYNDDPLTFYCEQNWWVNNPEKNSEPLGGKNICPEEKEIPVGQTVDNSEKWAEDFIKAIGEFVKKTDDIINYIRKIGDEKNYCQCNSECGDGTRTCQADCGFQLVYSESDPEAVTGSKCIQNDCAGNPCQKMINLLLGKKAADKCPEGTGWDGDNKTTVKGFEGVWWFSNEIHKNFISLNNFVAADQRSEVLKQLSYSRNQTDQCSVTTSAYIKETQILNCERVKDEIISPVIGGKELFDGRKIEDYCYGKILGIILKTEKPLMDNWFCCESR